MRVLITVVALIAPLAGCATEEVAAGAWTTPSAGAASPAPAVAPTYYYAAGSDGRGAVDPRAYRQFADALAPYGLWIELPRWGRAWIPSPMQVGSGFVPYASDGHWELGRFGWSWASDWSWGWAPFHYGRWLEDERFGWCWLPGTEWTPASVALRGGALADARR